MFAPTRLAVVATALLSLQGRGQPTAPPDTEIYLAPLTGSGSTLAVGTPANITNSKGYDNQPFFTPDGTAVLFTAMRDGTQTDVYRYDIASRRTTQVTRTPESEYSPTVTPDGGISVVRVEHDGTQRLWRFTQAGAEPRLLLENVKPVGYHAWSDAHTVAVFVLGQPATLQLADTRTGAVKTLASDIGRSIQPVPGRHTISFVQRTKTAGGLELSIKELDPTTGTITALTAAPPGSREADCAWAPDGTLLVATGGKLYRWRRGQNGWTVAADLERLGLKGVTRLAVSPRGDRIALVAEP